MLSETVFRSEDLPTADRFDRWRDLIGRTHAPLELRSDHQADFRASQRVLDLGAVSVWPTHFQPVCFRRTPRLIRQSDPEGLHLSLPLSGALRTVRGEEEAVHRPGSLCVVDTSRPVDVYGGDDARPHTGIGLEVPKAMLALPRNKVDRAARLSLSAQDGFGALLAQLLTQLAHGTGSYQPSDGPRLGAVVIDLLTGLFAHVAEAGNALGPETRRRTLVLRIRAYVHSRLHDPRLTPRDIAAAHHISVSYLHRLFQDEEETVAAWIRHQRLERARHDLADPALRATPVHAVAARWGFPRAADFTRAFRTAYGMSPSAYRANASPRTDA